jgi:hypothetical protein
MIPSIGTPVPIDLLQVRHPDWSKWIDRWKFFRDSHELTGPYGAVLTEYYGPSDAFNTIPSYLIPHEKESTREYQRRVREARCPRFVQQGISHLIGVLSQRSARRDKYPAAVRDWLNWVDTKGATWDLFVQNHVLPMMLRYGVCYVFPHRPALDVETEAQREASGLPRVVLDVISPEALVMWETDDYDRLTWARYYEEISLPAGPMGERSDRATVRRYWTIDAEGWWAVDYVAEDAEILEVGTKQVAHLRVCEAGRWDGQQVPEAGADIAPAGEPLFLAAPIAAVQYEGWRSPTETAALAQLEYYRVASELRKLESSTAFSMVWYPCLGTPDDPAEIVKGPDQVGTFPADSKQPPMMLSPDSGPFEHLSKRLADLKIESLLPYGIMGTDGVSSGIALAQVEHASSHQYRVASRALSQGEYAVMELVAPLLGEEMDPQSRAEWPTEFGALSSTKQIADLVEGSALTTDPEVKIELACKMVDLVLPDITDDRRNELRASIEQSVADDVEAAADMKRALEDAASEPPPAAGGAGAPELRPGEMSGEPSPNPGS